MIAVRVGWVSREEEAQGELRGFTGEMLDLVVDKAFAPGTPVKLSVEEMSLAGKSLGSKREGERFAMRVRLTNLRRTDRERLLALLDAR